jgi:hypothetical protein
LKITQQAINPNMDDPISMPIDGKAKQEMQAGIKEKLSEITGSQVDDVLPV